MKPFWTNPKNFDDCRKIFVDIGLRIRTAPLNNLAATAAPTATDDRRKGYSVGSLWKYTTTGQVSVMTRDSDVFISLEGRWQLANRYRPRLFVSVHADSSPRPAAEGFTLYIAHGASAQSRRAAQCLEDALAEAGRPSRGIRSAGFQVLIHTTCPAVLIEMGYLTHDREARELRDPRVQARLAQAIVAGIECY